MQTWKIVRVFGFIYIYIYMIMLSLCLSWTLVKFGLKK